ncbi:Fumarylacetoacetase-like C-terminal domain-containing protein [Candidatus Magnetomoraceae bacterium gMMP-15]
MKITQFIDNNRIRLGIIKGDNLIPIHFNGDMLDFIENNEKATAGASTISLNHVKLAPPVNRPSKIIAIGLNYKDHIEESNGKLPESPLIFSKFPNSVIGTMDLITWNTAISNKVDFEAELAVIIGQKTHNCSENKALEMVFGYTCANDVSARDLQFGDGQWVRGKSLDTFCPLGPWIVTKDEIPNPHNLKIRSFLNGNLMQDSSTCHLIFNIPRLVSFLSWHFTLFPGDVILTGTPSGVGVFREPPVYMKDGDEIEVEIQGIGKLVNQCKEKKF